jgi:hypothetical protein
MPMDQLDKVSQGRNKDGSIALSVGDEKADSPD